MNAPFKQAERLGRLTTALGADVLALLRFDGTDHLNDLFEYRVEALATRDDLDFDALVGTHATVEIEAHDQMRPFDGIVTSARWAGVGENGHRYDLTLRPWFWLAGRRRNQRIFHNKTVVQILQELLGEYAALGEPALEISLSKDYPTLEYTVQYRESDLDFARRQMERAGISFHFRHTPGSHTLVLTDDALAHEEIGARPFKRYDGHHQYEQEHFWDWAPERNITTGAVRLVDYNFKKPNQAMEAAQMGDAAHAQGQIESFDYPGDYLVQDVGKLVAGLRTEQERGADRRNRAVGDCVSLGAGMRMTLSGDKVPGLGETFLCLSASHHFVSEAYGSGGQGSDGYSFTGSYVLMPDTAPMAPPKRTAVAVVQGPQTAEVVGEGEIDCDEYGRILVRFHWDLANAYSMRCRVSQNWAGGGWGGMVIPRIGMEVLVEFLEGDPDKPVVVGNVFNGKNNAPYELPKHKTRSTFRTNTHDGKHGGRGFNELRFEDQQGEEEIFIHAQKDRNEKILHNHSERIDNNWVQSVGHNKSVDVRNNHVEAVGGDMVVSVGPSTIGQVVNAGLLGSSQGVGSAAAALGSPGVLSPGQGNMSLFVEKAKSETVGTLNAITAGISHSVTAGKSIEMTSGQMMSTTVAQRSTESVGSTKAIDVGDMFTLTVGASRLEMRKDGTIRLVGTDILIEGEARIKLKSELIKLLADRIEQN